MKARKLYDYEFLIKVTFMWEFDEDKPLLSGFGEIVAGCMATEQWYVGASNELGASSLKMTNAFNEIWCLSI